MNTVRRPNNYVWIVMLVLPLLFLLFTIPLLLLSGGQMILEEGLKYAGSSYDVANLEPAALGYVNMSMLKPLWEEVWIGISGIYLAFMLKQNKNFAWGLSLFWGIMLLTNAAIQGIYEVVLLKWPHACMQTYLFLGLGAIATVSLLIARKRYFLPQMRLAQ